MRTITYVNSTGAEISFSTTAPFLLTSFDESNDINNYNNKGNKQDGSTYLGNTLENKEITLEVAVKSSSMTEAIQNRNLLNQVFNPKLDEGWLFYEDEVKSIKIKCVPSKIPYWDKKDTDVIQECQISLIANNPFWQMEDVKKEIALWMGDFHFPVIIPQDTGIMVGHRVPSLIVNLINSGEVPCGMTIIFKALATLTNPSLFNVNTREYIKINKGMVAGEVITITTQIGNKKIIDSLNGVESDAMMYIDFLNSTFLQLAVGDNLFRYNADTGLDNLECTVIYSPQFLHT